MLDECSTVAGSCGVALKLIVFIVESCQHIVLNNVAASVLAKRVSVIHPLLEEVRGRVTYVTKPEMDRHAMLYGLLDDKCFECLEALNVMMAFLSVINVVGKLLELLGCGSHHVTLAMLEAVLTDAN